MASLARPAAALAAVLVPVLSLAADAGGGDVGEIRLPYQWFWLAAAVLLVVALLVLVFRADRYRRSAPPARRP